LKNKKNNYSEQPFEKEHTIKIIWDGVVPDNIYKIISSMHGLIDISSANSHSFGLLKLL